MLQRIVSRIDHVDMVQQYKRKDVISLEAVVALSLMDDSTVDCRLDSIKEENLIIKKWLRRAHGRGEEGKGEEPGAASRDARTYSISTRR